MLVTFTLLSMVLIALCFPWKGQRLWLNVSFVTLLSLSAIGIYCALGYPQGYALKDTLAQIEEDPASVDYDKVHAQLAQHLFWHPEDALAQTFQGRLYFASHDYQDAANSFAKAYALMPDDPDLLVEYATTLYLTGSSPEVLGKLVRMLIDHDNMPYTAHSLLANIAMDQGQPQLARTHWLALLRFIPKNSHEARQIRSLLAKYEDSK